MSHRAILVIDLQNDYFSSGRLPLVKIDEAAANAARVIAAGRENGDQIIHVRHEAIRPGATFFLPGTSGADIHASVTPGKNEAVIVKHHTNAFRETALAGLLQKGEIQEVVVVGAMSHMCIDAVTRAAVDLGFAATVLYDACATRDLVFDGHEVAAADVHAAFMAALSAYARLLSTDQWLAL